MNIVINDNKSLAFCQWIFLLLTLFCLQPAFAIPTTPTSDFIDNKDGTVTHKTTSLVWMRCAMGQTWTGSTCSGTASIYTYDQAVALINTFADHSNWRLPNIAELNTIVERENYDPAINNTIFPNSHTSNTPNDWFWSSSPYAYIGGYPWFVSFDLGYNGHTDGYSAIRLVRGGLSFDSLPLTTPSSDFIDNKDGTVTHKHTGLIWQRCAVGQTWTKSTCSGSANTYSYNQSLALKSTFANQNDWRVPNENELLSIVEYGAFRPAINSTLFPNTNADTWFWSSSPYASSTSSAWIVSFSSGFSVYSGKSSENAVRLVRGKWSYSLLPSVSKVYGKLHSNSARGAALADATVSIGTKTTTTANNGTFSLANIAAGQQVVNFTKSGYQSFSTMITVPKSGSYNMGNRWLVEDGGIQPTISITSFSLNFGDITVGKSADITFIVQNTGGQMLNGSCTSSSSLFSLPNSCSFDLSAGQYKAVTVRFKPANTGTFWGDIDFTSNGRNKTLTVTGKGIAVSTSNPCGKLVYRVLHKQTCELVDKLRNPAYFNISRSNVDDEHLIKYIENNIDTLNILLLQVDYGREISAHLKQGMLVTDKQKKFLKALGGTGDISEWLQHIVDLLAITNESTALLVTSQTLSTFAIIAEGIKVYNFGIKAISTAKTRTMLKFYFEDRIKLNSDTVAKIWEDFANTYSPELNIVAVGVGVPFDSKNLSCNELCTWFDNAFLAYRLVGYNDSVNIREAQGAAIAKLAAQIDNIPEVKIEDTDFLNFTYHPTLCAKEFGEYGIGNEKGSGYFLNEKGSGYFFIIM